MTDIYAQRRADIAAEHNLPWPETEKEFYHLANMRTRMIEPPVSLRGIPIQILQQAAGNSTTRLGWRYVYIQVNRDCSLIRVGEGVYDRYNMQVAAYLVNISPGYSRAPGTWGISDAVKDMIHMNGGYLDYFLLANWLSKTGSKVGEKAVRSLLRATGKAGIYG